MSLDDWAKESKAMYDRLEGKVDEKVSWLEKHPWTAVIVASAVFIAAVVGIGLLLV